MSIAPLLEALDYANSKQRLPSVNDAKHMEELVPSSVKQQALDASTRCSLIGQLALSHGAPSARRNNAECTRFEAKLKE